MTAKKQETPQYPSRGERISKLWHIYTTEYYSEIKKKKLIHTRGMKL